MIGGKVSCIDANLRIARPTGEQMQCAEQIRMSQKRAKEFIRRTTTLFIYPHCIASNVVAFGKQALALSTKLGTHEPSRSRDGGACRTSFLHQPTPFSMKTPCSLNH
jgi:hypothetical protein